MNKGEIKSPCCDVKVMATIIENGFEGQCTQCKNQFTIDVGAGFVGKVVIMPPKNNLNKPS